MSSLSDRVKSEPIKPIKAIMSKTPKDFSKMSKETQFLANYFKQEMNENTDKLIQRMDEKDKIIEDLRKNVNLSTKHSEGPRSRAQ